MQQALSIQIQGVFQIDFFHVGIGGSPDSDHVESVAVQMERVAQVGLLHCNRMAVLGAFTLKRLLGLGKNAVVRQQDTATVIFESCLATIGRATD